MEITHGRHDSAPRSCCGASASWNDKIWSKEPIGGHNFQLCGVDGCHGLQLVVERAQACVRSAEDAGRFELVEQPCPEGESESPPLR